MKFCSGLSLLDLAHMNPRHVKKRLVSNYQVDFGSLVLGTSVVSLMQLPVLLESDPHKMDPPIVKMVLLLRTLLPLICIDLHTSDFDCVCIVFSIIN